MTDKRLIQEDLNHLELLTTSDEDKARFERIKAETLAAVSIKKWLRRLVFGFSLSDAIERWLIAFNPSADKPINEQIPQAETREVVAAWMRFSLWRTLIVFGFSSLIAIITAYALIQQIKIQNNAIVKQDELITKQDELIQLQSLAEDNKNKFLFLQFLYDIKCEFKDNESRFIFRDKGDCLPVYNSRQRSEAVIGYVNLRNSEIKMAITDPTLMFTSSEHFVNLVGARLENTVLHEINFDYVRFSGANFNGSSLSFSKFNQSNLAGANMEDADLAFSELRSANFDKVNLKGAELLNADLRDAENLTCEQLIEANAWATTFRNKELSCGASIPEPLSSN